MKKIIAIVLAAVTMLSLVACGGSKGGKEITGTTEEILNQVLANAELSDPDYRALVDQGLMIMPIDEESVEYFLGVSGVDMESGYAAEPMMTSQPFSVCVIRVNDGVDVDELKEDIKSNVNPNKWLCVGVEPSDVIVDSVGNVVILIMARESTAFQDAFQALAK